MKVVALKCCYLVLMDREVADSNNESITSAHFEIGSVRYSY